MLQGLTLHQTIVQELAQEGARTTGFKKAVIDAVLQVDSIDISDEWEWRLLPDAFSIDHDSQTVYVFEVEISNPLTNDKIFEYERIWWMLDDIYWRLEVVSIDKYRNRNSVPIFYLDKGYAGPITEPMILSDKDRKWLREMYDGLSAVSLKSKACS